MACFVTMSLAGMAFSVRAWCAEEAVTVSFLEHDGAGPALAKKFGSYQSEKTFYVDRIYRADKTLGPLNFLSHRLNLELKDRADRKADQSWEILKDAGGYHFREHWPQHLGNYRPGPNAAAIRGALSAGGDVMICLGLPDSAELKARLRSDDDAVRTKALADLKGFCTDFTRVLCTEPYAGSRPLYLEIFNEPDIFKDDYGVAKEYKERFWSLFQAAYEGVAAAKCRNVKIGGCGLGFPEAPTTLAFLEKLKEHESSVKLDFLSFHHYFGWSDRSDLTDAAQLAKEPYGTDPASLQRRYDAMAGAMRKAGLSDNVPVYLTEYGWANGNFNVAAGKKSPERSSPRTMRGHQNAARTLEVIDLSLKVAGLERIYWAQGVGDVWVDDVFTYFPVVVYDDKAQAWLYKSAYYVWGYYNTMPGKRSKVTGGDAAIHAMASSDGRRHRLLLWNLSPQGRRVRLEFPGLGRPEAMPCTMIRIDADHYSAKLQVPQALPGVRTLKEAIAECEKTELAGEATLILDIAPR